MNNDNKYYTPELEEFHVGFGFEYLHPLSVSETTNEWQVYDWRSRMATVTLHPDGISIGGFSIKPECLRVKYLDKQDIEELGWEEGVHVNVWSDNDDIVNGYSYVLNNTETMIMFYSEESKVVGMYRQKIYNEITGNWTSDIMFAGIIKNKSELRKLMKQLGIL